MYDDYSFAKAILETIREPLIVLDGDLRVVSANRAFYQTFRVRPEETEGRFIAQIGDGQWDIPALRTLLEEIIPRDSEFNDYEVEHEFPGIGRRIMLLNARRIDGGGDRPNLILLAIEDETARLLAERRAASYAVELERSNRELQDFASVASHDLQEPLRKVRAFGDRLETTCDAHLGERGRDYLARMLDSVARMQVLIDDLLSYSRVGASDRPFVPVDLGRAAREVLRTLEVRIEQSGGVVELGPLPTVEADRAQMGQLLQNLIGNSLKFRREGVPPVIKVQGRIVPDDQGRPGARPGQVCEFSVEDNGIGFDPKYVGRIFQLFERLHARRDYEGTGIGLAISRKIVERHGGTITATGTPGQGATFLVRLPVRRSEGERAYA